jgi:hypothetical protein
MVATERLDGEMAFHRSITAPPGFPSLLSFDVGPSGDALTAWASVDGHARLSGRSSVNPSEPSFLISSPVDVAVVEHGPNSDAVAVLRNVSTSFPTVHGLPDGFLVVGSRCRWTTESVDHNALQYNRSGTVTATAVFGDGIQHVGVTTSGGAWVGYFDEGVFGNMGWGGPGPPPVGRFGLNYFDSGLHLAAHAPLEYEIADCYAMNVVDQSVYVCTYSEWEISMLSPDGAYRRWSNEVAGASGILVAHEVAALIGGYNDARDRLVIGELTDDQFAPLRTAALRVNGRSPSDGCHWVSRGPDLHVLQDDSWFRWSLPRRSSRGLKQTP